MEPIRVVIIGAGLSGLCLANALLNDASGRYTVSIYDRDDLAYSSDRGGYQIRLGQDGISGIKDCLDPAIYEELRSIWGNEMSRAPTFVDKNLSVLVDLNDLKLYPKSRAVPRSALKEYLLRKPLEKDCVRLSKKLKNAVVEAGDHAHTSIVRCEFSDGTNAEADILIAADGSGSLCNELFGIRNLTKLDHLSMQARGNISREAYEQLPETLKEKRALLIMTDEVQHFSALYEAGPSVNGAQADFFLFWGMAIGDKKMLELKALKSDDERLNRLEEELLKLGCADNGLPVLPRVGRHNVKIGHLGTSVPLAEPDWRKGNFGLGRIIFIGDSIHAMSPGRGQGANQAMRDAAELSKQLLSQAWTGEQSSRSPPTDKEVYDLAQIFDTEMYTRAFGWVKSSASATNIDTSSWKGFITIKLITNAVWLAGCGVAALERLGLRREVSIDF